MTSQNNPALNDHLGAAYRKLYDPARSYGESVAIRQAIPGLVGLWAGPQSGGGSTGYWADQSNSGSHLQRVGTPYSRLLGDLTPAMFFSGSGDYYTKAHDAVLGITGTEGHIYSGLRGITVLCWFYPTALGLGTQNQFVGKAISHVGNANNAYSLLKGSSDNFQFFIYNSTTVYASGAVAEATLNKWQFAVGRYIPSTEVSCWKGYQGSLSSIANTTSIPASVNVANTTSFGVGANGDGSAPHTGYLALPTVYEAALPTHLIETIYQVDRPAFND